MPSCAIMLRHTSHYRADAFAQGMARLGYQVIARPLRNPTDRDCLILWNRFRHMEGDIARYRAAGAKIIIAENAYLPMQSAKAFALALNGHNGTGSTPLGDRPRFEIPVRAWRERGDHVLVLLQRGIGQIGVAMPTSWPKEITGWLKRHTDRPVVVRRHPGGKDLPLDPQLRNCWAAITWGSGAACKAIAAGVPVFHGLQQWIGRDAAEFIDEGTSIELPFVGDRGEFMRRISWSQWTLDEIATGEAFAAVIQCEA